VNNVLNHENLQLLHGRGIANADIRRISIYTELDAYPLPRIDDMLNELAKHSILILSICTALTTRSK